MEQEEKLVSVIVPFFNEEATIPTFIQSLEHAIQVIRKDTQMSFEVVAVDDGSSDPSLKLLKQMREKYKNIRIISLSRNFGLQMAIHAGMEHANGDYLIVMDGDMQDPPEMISSMIAGILKGDADILVGRRKSRKEAWPKKFLFKLYHRLVEPRLPGVSPIDAGNFCIFPAQVRDAILSAGEVQRYFPGLRSWVGFRVDYFDYDRQKRVAGVPGMSYRRLLLLAGDSVILFSKWPIRICFIIGLADLAIIFLAAIYTLLSKFLGWAPFGWSSTFLAINFFGSLQLLFMGVLGEYIYKIFKEVQQRPKYILREFYDKMQ